MAASMHIAFTLILHVCVYTLVQCDSSCTNMMECTMYNMQGLDRKVNSLESNMATMMNQLSNIENLLRTTNANTLEKLADINSTVTSNMHKIDTILPQLTDNRQILLSHDLKYDFNQHTYELHLLDEKSSWEAGRDDCKSRGGDLVAFESLEEYEYFYNYIHLQKYNDVCSYIWTSANKLRGEWYWGDSDDPPLYKWSSGEPHTGGSGDCSMLNGYKDYTLKDTGCTGIMCYTCEYA